MPRTRRDGLAEELNKEEGFDVPKEKPRKKFEQTDYVRCRSAVKGGLFLEGAKTKQIYQWTDYGDVTEVEYRDLVSEVRAKTDMVFKPFFIVDDEDFVDEFPQLKQFYNQYYSIKDLREILDLPVHQMAKKIAELPKGAKDSLRNIAGSMVASGEIDSVAKIKALDEIFETDMEFMASLLK